MKVVSSVFGLPKRSVFKDLEVVSSGGSVMLRHGGKLYPASQSSPVLAEVLARRDLAQKLPSDFFGPTPPNIFIGEEGYPGVFGGPLLALEGNWAGSEGNGALKAGILDDPTRWSSLSYADLVRMRLQLVRGKKRISVREPDSRFATELQDSVLSTTPVDVEASFSKPPSFSMYFSPVAQPSGPSGMMERMELAGNPSIPAKIDSVIGEKLKVATAVPELLGHGFGYYYLQKLLSAGVLGVQRRLVPTKWAITATDDIIAKSVLQRVRDLPEVGEFSIYSNTFLSNHFEILLIPGKWEFEQFEAWAPATPWAAMGEGGIIQEHEPFEGRTTYAENEGGGYYAGRLACAEALDALNRQARVVVFREIGAGYEVPLGVWQVRENVRNAFRNSPAKCATLQEALGVLGSRLERPIRHYVSKSVILSQKRMGEWF
ncbi:hypothetical protein HY995_03570 [Candidatus Micrarchaeota archaeon]|nr:hypothetical protein [Candidatus Micrarchaeota archaeon]